MFAVKTEERLLVTVLAVEVDGVLEVNMLEGDCVLEVDCVFGVDCVFEVDCVLEVNVLEGDCVLEVNVFEEVCVLEVDCVPEVDCVFGVDCVFEVSEDDVLELSEDTAELDERIEEVEVEDVKPRVCVDGPVVLDEIAVV